MVFSDTYRAFADPTQILAVGSRNLLPLMWQADFVDRTALRALRAFFATDERPHYRLLPEGFAAAAGVYTAPNLRARPESFFRPPAPPEHVAVERLGSLKGGQRLRVAFKSTYQTYHPVYHTTYASFGGNEVVHARLWRHFGPPRPTVICIHGWGTGYLWLEEQIFSAARLYRAGLNVALMTLPFHGARKPAGRFDLNLFPSCDLRRTNEAFGQAVADVQTLMNWLRSIGAAQRLGLMGMSLGGYVAALVASLDASLDFVMPVITPVSLGDLLWNLEVDAAGKAVAAARGFGLEQFREAMAVHCPLSYSLKIPKERALIVGGRADRVVPAAHTLALWEHWGQPRLRWFPGSHCMHFGRGAYLQDLCELACASVQESAPVPATSMLLGWLQRIGMRVTNVRAAPVTR